MTQTSKILATVGIIVIFMILSAVLQMGSEQGGRNPGIFGIVLFIGLIAGIRSVWKKNNDNTKLKKD